MSATTRLLTRRRGIDLLLDVPTTLAIFAMMIHITANALFRSLANQPLAQTLEIVQYWYLPVVALLGFVTAQHRNEHITAGLIYEKLPRVVQRFVHLSTLVACCLVSFGFAWHGWGEAVSALEVNMTAGPSEVIIWPVYFLVPLAFACLTLQFAVVAIRAFRGTEEVLWASGPLDVEGGNLLAQQESSGAPSQKKEQR